MDIKKIVKERFWHTISKKSQLEIAIRDIEEWLQNPDSSICPFGKKWIREDWEGGCSLCFVFFEAESGCPCYVHGKSYTIEKAKEILKILKSLQGGKSYGKVY